ncbi:NACHT domain-containing protein [Aeromonas hydrophila]|uniref:NACHT domain-containing protein n=1 Tax=Aeromonas hydrophila TaxID=644 RepID=UPI003F7B24EF
MEALSTVLTTAALEELVKGLVSHLLSRPWSHEVDLGKDLLRQLSESSAATIYVDKYVSKSLKMRTLHSVESDVYLDEIYSPLKLIAQSNGDEFLIDDKVTLSLGRVINIIGLAGQGKSTILKKLFLEEMRAKKRFPFIIELRKVESSSIMDVFKGTLVSIGLSIQTGSVELLLQSRKVVLMLDGFDEISSSKRMSVLQEIITIKTRYDCDILVTTRPDTEICREVGVTNVTVKKLNENDVISILSKLDKKQELTELPELIKNNKSLRETLVTPILVNLLYVCYPYLDVVPENIVDFYDKLFFTLYSRHDKIKNFNREKYSNITSVQAVNIFNAFCFDSLSKGILDFSEDSLNSHLIKSLHINGISCDGIDNVRSDIINITCLIQRDGYDRYVFLHKSIQEFHAAKFIRSLSFEHKSRLYNRLLEVVDSEDKYDYVINFLKAIDTNDYESLLVMKYFEKYFGTHLLEVFDSVDLDLMAKRVLSVLDSGFTIENGGDNSYQCSQVGGIYNNNNILSVFSLFKFGVRNGIKFRGRAEKTLLATMFERESSSLFPREGVMRITVEQLRSIAKSSYLNSDEVEEELIIVSVHDYLHATGTYNYIANSIKDEIILAYNDIYRPLRVKKDTVSKALDIDFN